VSSFIINLDVKILPKISKSIAEKFILNLRHLGNKSLEKKNFPSKNASHPFQVSNYFCST
jgi:hypothetical protein